MLAQLGWVNLCEPCFELLDAINSDRACELIMNMRTTIPVTLDSQRIELECAHNCCWLHVLRTEPTHVKLEPASPASVHKFDHRRHRPQKRSCWVLNGPRDAMIMAQHCKLNCDIQENISQLHFLQIFPSQMLETPQCRFGSKRRWASIILPSNAERRTRRSEMNS